MSETYMQQISRECRELAEKVALLIANLEIKDIHFTTSQLGEAVQTLSFKVGSLAIYYQNVLDGAAMEDLQRRLDAEAIRKKGAEVFSQFVGDKGPEQISRDGLTEVLANLVCGDVESVIREVDRRSDGTTIRVEIRFHPREKQ